MFINIINNKNNNIQKNDIKDARDLNKPINDLNKEVDKRIDSIATAVLNSKRLH